MEKQYCDDTLEQDHLDNISEITEINDHTSNTH